MNPIMEQNLEDLKDIKRHMDEYYPLGQEYLRQLDILHNQEKTASRFKDQNKMKYVIGSIVAGVVIMPLIFVGAVAAAVFYFGYEKIQDIVKKQCSEQAEKLMDVNKRYWDSYGPVQEKCTRLLFDRDDYEVPMAVDYLIRMIEDGRADTMKEAYNMLDEQLYRWKMENMQNTQLQMQQKQCKQLRNIEAATTANVMLDFARLFR